MKVKQLVMDIGSQTHKGHDKLVYMCLNAHCFYCETILSVDEIHWKETWNSEIEDLDMIPHCPSCLEVMWRERG